MSNDTIAMVPVPNCAGAIRFIPSDRASDRIDADWLKQNSACDSGSAWFLKTFPEGCTYLELRAKFAEEKRNEWESWMCARKGGDVATAGDSGTATAGYRGTATAGLEGIIRILEWDAKQSRYRVVTGIIGENDIEADTPYVVVEGKLVKKSVESEA